MSAGLTGLAHHPDLVEVGTWLQQMLVEPLAMFDASLDLTNEDQRQAFD